jgi:preprotein translocase subunit SecG
VIVAKAFLATLFAVIGLWLWRMASTWSTNGKIPKDWVESVDPLPVCPDDPHFVNAIAWQKIMAVLAWLFVGLFVISIALELTGNL